MATSTNGQALTKVITGVVRLSYAHLFEPHSMDGEGQGKYSVSLIISKSDKQTLDAIARAINEAKKVGAEKKWGGKIPVNLKMPLRDGDTEREGDEAYANSYFVNATANTKPGVVLPQKGPDGKFMPATPEDVYSGCYAKVSINFYPFNSNGNKGIACGLNNVMFHHDGDSLGGRVDADTDFKDEEIDTTDYSDLLG